MIWFENIKKIMYLTGCNNIQELKHACIIEGEKYWLILSLIKNTKESR